MNDTIAQLTLRRWAEFFSSRRFYVVFGAFIVGSTILGPYGFKGDMAFSHRLGFAIIINSVCWGLGILITTPVRLFLEKKGVDRRLSILIGASTSMIAMLPAAAWILSMEIGELPPLFRLFEVLVLFTLLVIIMAFNFVVPSRTVKELETGQPNDTVTDMACYAVPEQCEVQQKIPSEKRGIMLAMVAQDHYLEIITDKGSELILMRLSDAMAVCKSEESLQIHRSAWITRQGLARLRKDGRKVIAVLVNGKELPVSRSAEANVKNFAKRFGISGDSPSVGLSSAS